MICESQLDSANDMQMTCDNFRNSIQIGYTWERAEYRMCHW